LSRVPRVTNSNVLVGFDTSDDAGVYQLTPERALVQTLDFFTPIVDDPELFGAIAAANALSDVYAMGGTPLTALSILCYPQKGDLDVLADILRGGATKLREANCMLLGGHSVNDDDIKFGFSITGEVHPRRIWSNNGAQAGDVLVFTKRLGTGVLGTALKRGLLSEGQLSPAMESMLTLNRAAAEALRDCEVHACTDITGFGLLGHARELALASQVSLHIHAAQVPALPHALEAIAAGAIPAGLRNNEMFVESCVHWSAAVSAEQRLLLYDPQTSGGLLLSLPPASAATFAERFPAAVRIGEVIAKGDHPIWVR
jgi:selenide, water dikinase